MPIALRHSIFVLLVLYDVWLAAFPPSPSFNPPYHVLDLRKCVILTRYR